MMNKRANANAAGADGVPQAPVPPVPLQRRGMVRRAWPRHSTIALDVGTCGTRVFQLRGTGTRPRVSEHLLTEREFVPEDVPAAAMEPDAAAFEDLLRRARFTGRLVSLVLSPPEVQFFPLRVPSEALQQPAERVEQALKWEVAQESRCAAEELELRYWRLPEAAGRQSNVMAVVLPTERALTWCAQAQRCGLTIKRIDVSPCALARLALCAMPATPHDLWGVVDLGLRHATLTVAVGNTPAYIRTLNSGPREWTQRLAGALDVPQAVAEQIKRGGRTGTIGRGGYEGGRRSSDLEFSRVLDGLIREAIQRLADEIRRCFAYVMQSYPDHNVSHLFLAGGGAALDQLAETLQDSLGLAVKRLSHETFDRQNTLGEVPFDAASAAAIGTALGDLV